MDIFNDPDDQGFERSMIKRLVTRKPGAEVCMTGIQIDRLWRNFYPVRIPTKRHPLQRNLSIIDGQMRNSMSASFPSHLAQ